MSPPSIGVVCAPPNGHNPGMSSVDLAVVALVERHQLGPVRLWRPWQHDPARGGPRPFSETPDAWVDPYTGLGYELLANRLDEALEADLLLYWGDFLHLGPHLAEQARALASTGALADVDAATRFLHEHLLLDGRSEAELDRASTFGSTLLLNGPADRGGAYERALARFVGGLRRCWFRDRWSAGLARGWRNPGDERSCLGVDAALLDAAHHTPVGVDGPVGVFFGRSHVPPEVLGRFVRHVCRAASAPPAWIDWGTEPAFWPMRARKRFRLALPEIDAFDAAGDGWAAVGPRRRAVHAVEVVSGGSPPPVEGATRSASVLAALAEHRLVVTDTYHLALNAWARGVPALCVVDEPRGTSWNVNHGDPGEPRDKRVALFEQLEVADAIVPVSTISSARRARSVAGASTEALLDPDEVVRVHRRARALAEAAEADLVASVRAAVAA